MSASNRIRRSLIACAALVGFSAMANAAPHAGHDVRGTSHGSYRTFPWNGYRVSPYSAYRSADHFDAPYCRQRNRTPWGAGVGTGVYHGNAYGRSGIKRYDFHDHH